MLRFLEGVPGALGAALLEIGGHGHHAALDGGADGLDEQRVHLGIDDGAGLDHVHAQPVELLGKLDLLAEAEIHAGRLAGLLHGHVADGNHVHGDAPFAKKSLRPGPQGRSLFAVPPCFICMADALSGSDKPMACNAAGRTQLLGNRSQRQLGKQTAFYVRRRLAPTAGSLGRSDRGIIPSKHLDIWFALFKHTARKKSRWT